MPHGRPQGLPRPALLRLPKASLRPSSPFPAELCALVQAAHVAATHKDVEVAIHVDASAALHAVGEVCSGSSPFKFAHPDLLQLLPAHPVSACLQKVKSHQDPDQVPDNLLRAAQGNWKADEAAKAARAQDLSCVTEAADRIAVWRKQQAGMLQKYFHYLVELAQLVVPFKQASQGADRTPATTLDIGSPTVAVTDARACYRIWARSCGRLGSQRPCGAGRVAWHGLRSAARRPRCQASPAWSSW